jgi:GT2 family glycosyltransferase/tetratricopeptide (TPR) repeat protein
MDAEKTVHRATQQLTSIVIVTHNQLAYTRLCINSLLRHTREPFELIVVDNGSSDGTVEYLREPGERAHTLDQTALHRFTVLSNTENRGFPVAANQAIGVAVGETVLLLNNDTIVTEEWLGRLRNALSCDATVGMVGPCSNFVSGPQQVSVPYGGHRPTGIDECDISDIERFACHWGDANAGQTQEVDRLVGFCLLIRRSVIDSIGLLDERFGIGNFEDDDYSRRSRDAGFRLLIAKDAFVHHYGGCTFRGSGIDHGDLLRRNEELFREKWNRADSRSAGLATQFGIASKLDAPTTSLASPVCGTRREQPAAVLSSVIVSLEPILVTGDLSDESPRPLLSLCMIARDNEGTIGAALDVIRHYVDDMVVVDTGSKDRTPDIAASLGARVFHFAWCDDFSAARNESIRHAIGQWIFWMDTDDSIDHENARKVRDAVSGPVPQNVMGFSAKVRCPEMSSNGETQFVEVDHIKIFRNQPQLRFEGRIHEQILMAIRRAAGIFEWTDIFVVHSGADYSPEGRAKKMERDLRILELDHRERPDHPFVLFNLGMTYTEAGRYDQAIAFLWQSIGRASPNESHLRKAYAHLVTCYDKLGRGKIALETCLQGLERIPADPELTFLQGALLQRYGRLNEARTVFEALRQQSSDRHFSSVDRGIKGHRSARHLAGICSELGELAKAEEYWRLVVSELPSDGTAWGGLVDVLIRRGKLADAAAVTDRLANDPLMRRHGLVLRSAVFVAQREYDAARRDLVRARTHCPDDRQSLEALCQLLFEYFSPDEAELTLRELIELSPDNPSAHHNLGMILYRRGNHTAAIDSYQRSIQCRPDHASTHLHLGFALNESGRLEEALAAFEHARSLTPTDEGAILERRVQAR